MHEISCNDLNQCHIYPNSSARKTSVVRCIVYFNTLKPQIYSRAGLVYIRVVLCCKMKQVLLHYSLEGNSDFSPFSWRSDANHLLPKLRNRIKQKNSKNLSFVLGNDTSNGVKFQCGDFEVNQVSGIFAERFFILCWTNFFSTATHKM